MTERTNDISRTRVPYLTLLCLTLLFHCLSPAQDKKKNKGESLAFRNNEWYLSFFPVLVPEYSYRFEEAFQLVRRANSGDAIAQHELGLRYLTGDGFDRDTAKSFVWIEKSAAQGLPSACYNLGLFYHNAWRIEWNPYTAFRWFKEAAVGGLPDGAFVVALTYTENLVIQKNIDSAYYWMKRAAAQRFAPAVEALVRMRREFLEARTDSINKTVYVRDSAIAKKLPLGGSIGFLDPARDTLVIPEDSAFFLTTLRDGGKELREHLGFGKSDSIELLSQDSVLSILTASANTGSPEANLFLARFYEKGIFVKRDLMSALKYYLRAMRLEAPQAGIYAMKLTARKELMKQFDRAAAERKPDALYVFAMLNSLGYQSSMTQKMVVQWLEEAAGQGHVFSMLELAQRCFTGNGIEQNVQKAKDYWETALRLGSSEAALRELFASIGEQNKPLDVIDHSFVESQNAHGSIVAQVILGYLHENGIGVPKNRYKASVEYRVAASRGSSFAFTSLRRLYDEIRPGDPQFQLVEH